MKKSLLSTAIGDALAVMFAVRSFRTHDISFGYRMPAGFPGDVNRTHPASIVPGIMNTTVQAPRLFGDPVVIDTATNSYRGVTAGDITTFAVDGFVVRPYPTQQTTGGLTASIGGGAPSINQPVDVLSDGFIMAKCYVGAPLKGGAVYVYTGVSTGSHVQGGLEAAAVANATLISNAFWNGPADSNGVTELRTTAARI